MLEKIKKEAKALQNQIVEWRRALHQIPETCVNTPQSEAYLCGELDKLGIPYKKGLGKHGIVALVEGKKSASKKVFGLRADFDGLPIQEETGLPFASTNGNMHACGHDTHAAMLLGAAKILKDNADLLSGTVKLFFQPGEEGCPDGPGGAKQMIDDGALNNPRPDAMSALHIANMALGPDVKSGAIFTRHGSIMACMDRFSITVKGKGAHGAQPNNSVDPISVAAQIISTVQTLISREIDPLEPGIVSICQVHAGSAFNIIPNECFIQGTVRALNRETREMLARRIGEIAKATAEGMRASVEYDFNWDGPVPLVNNDAMTDSFQATIAEMFGSDMIHELPRPIMGGEDFAFFAEQIPATFAFLNARNESTGKTVAAHNPKFDIDEDVFWIGSAALAGVSMNWLEKNRV